MEAFKNGNFEQLVSQLAKAIRLDHQLVTAPRLFTEILDKRFKTHPGFVHNKKYCKHLLDGSIRNFLS